MSLARGWARALGVGVSVGGSGVAVGVADAVGVMVGVGAVAVAVGVGGTYGVGVKVAINTRVGPLTTVGVALAVAALRGTSESAPPIEQPRELSASSMTTTNTPARADTARFAGAADESPPMVGLD